METKEREFDGLRLTGFLAILINLVLLLVSIWCVLTASSALLVIGVVGILLAALMILGYVIIEPNDARVLVFFGRYVGTVTRNGFYWVNPLYAKRKLTLRARNMDIEPVKVNDKAGNPIMIGAVLVWKVKDSYKVSFDIDSGGADVMRAATNFVAVQSDAALRQVAGMYAYDNNDGKVETITLRSNGDEVSQQLEAELNSRLAIAGVEVIEARINYLAYAAEIASVMLRRQQADAIIAAREKIVEGAVSMVQLALKKLEEDHVVDLDEERKAAMVSNLLVVLCADEAAQPIVNAGTLHH